MLLCTKNMSIYCNALNICINIVLWVIKNILTKWNEFLSLKFVFVSKDRLDLYLNIKDIQLTSKRAN